MARLKLPVKIDNKGEKMVILIRTYESAAVDLSIPQVGVLESTADAATNGHSAAIATVRLPIRSYDRC
jgi:hypothetical protein